MAGHAVKAKVSVVEHSAPPLPTPGSYQQYVPTGDPALYLNVQNLSITLGVGYCQDISLPTGKTLITTAYGVAPPGLEYKCLWLRSEYLTWELVQHDGHQILIPRLKKVP